MNKFFSGLCSFRIGKAAFLGAVFYLGCANSIMAADEPNGVYIIYDSSNSMWAALPDKSRKYEAARTAMRELAGSNFGGRDVALRMYGHRRKNDCTDSELLVPFSSPEDAAGRMVDAMETVRPTGRTPIDLSLRQALNDFGDRKGSIILISDGIESCDADPCALVTAWREKNVDITVHVVGLGLKGKEKAAMQCIADAAGTEYRDAFSAGELIDSLGAVLETAKDGNKPEAGTPAPTHEDTEPAFALVVETADGARQLGVGILKPATGEAIEVESFQRYTPAPGPYQLSAGVRTIDGEAYNPVTVDVSIADSGRTIGNVTAPRPPEVGATFAMEGEDLRATVVMVFRDGKKLGSFKGDETAFVPEGELVFQSKLRGTSKPLSVTETFGQGDAKTISFDAAVEVHLTVIAKGTANGVRLRGRPAVELWQGGKRVHKVNTTSGGLVTPGAYTLRIDDRLNLFETEIVVTREPKQVLELNVPAGGLMVLYQDAAGKEMKPERVFITPARTKRRQLRSSNEQLILIPGSYKITGFPKDRGFPETEIQVTAGAEQTITLKATK